MRSFRGEIEFIQLNSKLTAYIDLGPSTPVKELLLDPSGEKVTPHPQGILTVPQYPHEKIEWNLEKREIRLLVDHKVHHPMLEWRISDPSPDFHHRLSKSSKILVAPAQLSSTRITFLRVWAIIQFGNGICITTPIWPLACPKNWTWPYPISCGYILTMSPASLRQEHGLSLCRVHAMVVL